MSKRRIPCGRTNSDKYLCCKRKHRWYNSYWKLKRTGKRLSFEKKCLICGSTIQLGGHPFERGW